MAEILNPHDADLEEVVLGACLLETAAMALVGDKLRAEMFYEQSNCEIFSALLAMYHTGRSIDIITVKNELAARGKLEAVGGPFRLTQLTSRV
ncbi:MAG: replicative DNA helicase, partial [Bacteroides oleiciplenus]|nr:replicative DNA helicase [Bacteroides oleiciplenus]